MSFSLRSLRNLCVLCVLSFSFETLLDRDMNKRQAGLLALILFTIVAILHLIHLEKWAVLNLIFRHWQPVPEYILCRDGEVGRRPLMQEYGVQTL